MTPKHHQQKTPPPGKIKCIEKRSSLNGRYIFLYAELSRYYNTRQRYLTFHLYNLKNTSYDTGTNHPYPNTDALGCKVRRTWSVWYYLLLWLTSIPWVHWTYCCVQASLCEPQDSVTGVCSSLSHRICLQWPRLSCASYLYSQSMWLYHFWSYLAHTANSV